MSVGMPADLWLHEFGSQVWFAFDAMPYLVGSALEKKTGWRDVDVRVLLEQGEWDRLGLGEPDRTSQNGRWVALCLAFSALGQKMTGLPIDFQIQLREWANEKFKGCSRSALGMVPLRFEHHGCPPKEPTP